MSEYEKRCKVCGAVVEDPTKDTCNFCTQINTPSTPKEEKKKKAPKVRTINGSKPTAGYEIVLICSDCGKNVKVHVNNPAFYTEEVRKIWKCIKCKYIKE